MVTLIEKCEIRVRRIVNLNSVSDHEEFSLQESLHYN